jgi:transposase
MTTLLQNEVLAAYDKGGTSCYNIAKATGASANHVKRTLDIHRPGWALECERRRHAERIAKREASHEQA